MNPEYIKQAIINDQRQRNVSLDEAAESLTRRFASSRPTAGPQGPGLLIRGFGLADRSVVDAVVLEMRAEARRNQMLDIPSGVHDKEYREAIADDAKELLWYTGPRETDRYWGYVRSHMEAGGLGAVLPEIDDASTKVIAHFADPGTQL